MTTVTEDPAAAGDAPATTTFIHDGLAQWYVTQIVDAAGLVRRWSFYGVDDGGAAPTEAFGQVARRWRLGAATGAAAWTRFRYDHHRRPINESLHGADASLLARTDTTYTFDADTGHETVAAFRLHTAGSGDVYVERTVRDSLGRSVQVEQQGEDGSTIQTKQVYGAFGRVWLSSEPHRPTEPPRWTVTDVDAIGRHKSVEWAGEERQFTYGAFVTNTWDANGALSQFEADGRNRLVRRVQPGGLATKIAYGSSLEAPSESITTPEGHTVHIHRDGLGRPVKRVDPDRGTATATYDARDRVVSVVRPDGSTTVSSYDELDRVLTLDHGADGVVDHTFYYDGRTPEAPDTIEPAAIGSLSAEVDALQAVRLFHDDAGRPVRVERTIAGTLYAVDLGYDLLDRVRGYAVDLPGSGADIQVRYELGPEGPTGLQFTNATGTWLPAIDGTQRDGAGRVRTRSFGNGVILGNQYDAAGRLEQRTFTSALSGTKHVSWLYERDAAAQPAGSVGFITAIRDQLEPAHDRTFEYDESYRLTLETSALESTGFTYSADDNMLTRGSLVMSYDGPQPHAVSKVTDVSTGEIRLFTYDDAGRAVNDGSRSFQYDALGQVSRAHVFGAGYVDFERDSTGSVRRKRIYETSSGVISLESTTVTPFGRLLEVKTSAGGEVTALHHLIMGGERLATHVRPSSGAASTRYYVTDHVGSSVLVLDESGATLSQGGLLQESRYTAYGIPMNDSGGPQFSGWTNSSAMFVGAPLDATSLLYATGPRAYDPALGRFLQPDPLPGGPAAPATRNPYSWGLNNPIAFHDASGLKAEPPADMCHVCEYPDFEIKGSVDKSSNGPEFELGWFDEDNGPGEVGPRNAGHSAGGGGSKADRANTGHQSSPTPAWNGPRISARRSTPRRRERSRQVWRNRADGATSLLGAKLDLYADVLKGPARTAVKLIALSANYATTQRGAGKKSSENTAKDFAHDSLGVFPAWGVARGFTTLVLGEDITHPDVIADKVRRARDGLAESTVKGIGSGLGRGAMKSIESSLERKTLKDWLK